MDVPGRATLRTTSFLVVVLAVLGVGILAGLVVASDGPSGAAVLGDVEDRYASAESVVIDADVTVEHDGTVSEYTVRSVTTADGAMRLNVSNDTDYAVLGRTDTTSWMTSSRTDGPLVIREGSVVGQSSLSTEANASTILTNASDRPGMADPFGANTSLTPANLSVSTVLAETNWTAEVLETTSVGGDSVHVVRTTSPDHDAVGTLWVRTDDATVVRYRTRTPNGTVTVDVSETHFDVSPAGSTFRPPGASDWRTTADTLAALRATADRPLAVPDGDWTFRSGTVIATPVSAVASQYRADGTNLTVIQANASTVPAGPADGRTVDVAGRTVIVTDSEERTAVRWSEGDRMVVLTGDLGEEELLDVVATVDFVPTPD